MMRNRGVLLVVLRLFLFAFCLSRPASAQNAANSGLADRSESPTTAQPLDHTLPAYEQAFIDWARQNAIPLKTVEAGHGFDDMAPLAQIIGNARIVELGEATHGTHEFFAMKHRMVEYLAMQKGFFVLDLRRIPQQGPAADWLLDNHRSRSVGAVYRDAAHDRYWTNVRQQEAFDAVIFIERTTASRPMP